MPTKPDTGSPAGPGRPDEDATTGAGVFLEARDLRPALGTRSRALARLAGRRDRAPADQGGVSLTLGEGHVLGLVGGPGSGKTALGRALVGLARPAGGSVRYRGREISGLGERRMRTLGPRLQTVFLAGPGAPLSPFAAGTDLATAITRHLRSLRPAGADCDAAALDTAVRRALERTGLTPADAHLERDTAALTGLDRQRAAVARAIAGDPELLLAGEPPSAPGTPGHTEVMRLLLDLSRETGLTVVHLTRDLATARTFCDTLAVVHHGRIVETGPARQMGDEPRHPYTRALLTAVPAHDVRRGHDGHGGPPDPARPPLGCVYHPRCPVALDRCGWEARDLLALVEQRWLDLDPEQAARERRLLGRLEDLREPGRSRVVLAPGKGHDAAAVLSYFQRLRQEASAKEPREPFWRGVARLYEDSGRVVVEFSPAEEPLLRPGAPPPAERPTVRVACHRHPDTAG